MCNIWQNPTDKNKEITPAEIEKLPKVKFINITGGEPFIREDLEEIVKVAFHKSPRVVISTSGWFEERIIRLAEKFPKIGIRISIEGLSFCRSDFFIFICGILPYITHLALHRAAICNNDTHVSGGIYSGFHIYAVHLFAKILFFIPFYYFKPLLIIMLTGEALQGHGG